MGIFNRSKKETNDTSNLLDNLLNMEVKDVMVHRIDCVFINVKSNLKKILKIIKKHPFSRYPVYHNTKDNISGILDIRNIIVMMEDISDKRDVSLESYILPPFFVPEIKRVGELIKDYRFRDSGMAIVVDEYGSVSGIVTPSDIIDELVGDIWPIYDSDRELIKKLSNNTYEVNARCDIETLSNELGIDIDTQSDTVGGFIIELASRIPHKNTTIKYKNLLIKVLNATKSRIINVLITKK